MFESEITYACAECGYTFRARPIACACGALFPADGSKELAIKVRQESGNARIKLAVSFVPGDGDDD